MDNFCLQTVLGRAIAGWLADNGQATTSDQIEQIVLSATDAVSGCMTRLRIHPNDFVFPRRAPEPGRKEAECLRAKAVIGEALQTATEAPSKPASTPAADSLPVHAVIPLRFDLDISVSGFADGRAHREKSE